MINRIVGSSQSCARRRDHLKTANITHQKVADSGFVALELLAAVRHHVCLITRLRLDAALYKPVPPRRKGQRGRLPLKGRRLPTLSAVLASRKTIRTTVVVSQWYSAQQRKLLTATGTGTAV